MDRTRRTFDELRDRAAAMMLAVGRLEAAEERGEAIVRGAHAEGWRKGDAVDDGGG